MTKSPVKLTSLRLISFTLAAISVWGATQAADQPQVSVKKHLAPMPQCREAKAGGPEEVVRKLYTQYPYKGNKAIQGESDEVLAKFFDEKFAVLLAEERDCVHSSHAICVFDWSIMYEAQDGDVTDLHVCQMEPGTHGVKVQFRNFGDPQVITYVIRNTSVGWRISDIAGSALALSSYFDNLASAWEKAQAPEQPQASDKGQKPLPQCERAKAGGPEDMVRMIYEQYPWKGDKIITNEPRDVLLKFFDENLAGLIVKAQECRARGDRRCASAEIPNIMINRDMDSSQEIRGFHICAMDTLTKMVRVQFRDHGEPAIVIYKLANTDAGWRISDILYLMEIGPRDLGLPEAWSMVEALSGGND